MTKYIQKTFHRFGDDLCQLLLSYLTIEHKFVSECVSKQWQRLVYNKQLKLNICHQIYNKNIDQNVDTITKLTSKPFRFGSAKIKLSSLETVLNKLRFT